MPSPNLCIVYKIWVDFMHYIQCKRKKNKTGNLQNINILVMNNHLKPKQNLREFFSYKIWLICQIPSPPPPKKLLTNYFHNA